MKLETNEHQQGSAADIYEISKRFYNEQRGRIVGNTVPWHELTTDQQVIIMDEIIVLMETMSEVWRVPGR